MNDFGSREERIRTPVKGLRQRLRIALRESGVTQKFRTDHGRKFMGDGGPFLIVISKELINIPFNTFEGLPVALRIIDDHGNIR